jgi:hypothetical protein
MRIINLKKVNQMYKIILLTIVTLIVLGCVATETLRPRPISNDVTFNGNFKLTCRAGSEYVEGTSGVKCAQLLEQVLDDIKIYSPYIIVSKNDWKTTPDEYFRLLDSLEKTQMRDEFVEKTEYRGKTLVYKKSVSKDFYVGKYLIEGVLFCEINKGVSFRGEFDSEPITKLNEYSFDCN